MDITRIDSTVPLLREGYAFLGNQRRRLGRDIFDLRVLGVPLTAVSGAEGARLFYDESRIRRTGALPRAVQKTLFGMGAVHTLDGAAHRARKALFLSVMTPDGIRYVADRAVSEARAAAASWARQDRVVLFDEIPRVLLRAVCSWVQVPIDDAEVPVRARDMIAMVDGFGSLGYRHGRARLARWRSERWLEDVVAGVRAGRRPVPLGSPLDAFVRHVEPDGGPLPDRLAAIELLNLIRPTVAATWFVAHGALALHRHPDWAVRLRDADDATTERFVHEVRRVCPLAPFLGARADHTFVWQGHRVPAGRIVLLDVHGTDHDPRVWTEPQRFDPDRYLDHPPSPFDFLPQGGGDPATGHRCAGEHLTIEVVKGLVGFLARDIDAEVPPQDLDVPLTRFPARPRSGVALARVRQRHTATVS